MFTFAVRDSPRRAPDEADGGECCCVVPRRGLLLARRGVLRARRGVLRAGLARRIRQRGLRRVRLTRVRLARLVARRLPSRMPSPPRSTPIFSSPVPVTYVNADAERDLPPGDHRLPLKR